MHGHTQTPGHGNQVIPIGDTMTGAASQARVVGNPTRGTHLQCVTCDGGTSEATVHPAMDGDMAKRCNGFGLLGSSDSSEWGQARQRFFGLGSRKQSFWTNGGYLASSACASRI